LGVSDHIFQFQSVTNKLASFLQRTTYCCTDSNDLP